MRPILFYLFLLAVPFLGLAQYPFEYPIRFTEEDGLPNDYVRMVEQDSEGFLWVGTFSGLSRFDGSRFRTISKPDIAGVHTQFILHLLRDRLGRMWVCAGDGLTMYEPKHLQAHPIISDRNTENEHFNVVYEDRQGEIWAGSNLNGICKLDTAHFVFKSYVWQRTDKLENTALNHLYAITQDVYNDSILWLGTQGGLVQFNKYAKEFAWFPFETAIKDQNERYAAANTVFAHSDGHIYVGSWGGILAFDIKNRQFHDVFNIIEPIGPREFTFVDRGNHQLWLTYDQGLIIYNTQKQQIEKIYRNNLESKEPKVYGISFTDTQGRAWLRSSVGLFLFNPLLEQFKTYNNPLIGKLDYNSFVNGMLESQDKQSLYICPIRKGHFYVFHRSTQTWTSIPLPIDDKKYGGFELREIKRLKDGRVIILSSNSLYLLHENTLTLERLPLRNVLKNIVMQELLEDRNGNLWIGTVNGGLLKMDPQTWEMQQFKTALNTKDFPNRYGRVGALCEDDLGNIWIQLNPGYSIYNPQQDTFLHFPRKGEIIFSFTKDKQGFIWQSVFNQGLFQYDPRHPEKGPIKKYTVKNGLIDHPIYLLSDQGGTIWIQHGKGISAFDPVQHVFRHFDKTYNIPVEENNEKPILLSTGEIAIPTERGICIFNPAQLRVNTELPRPYFTSFKIFDQEIDSNELKNNCLNLSYKQNFFSFEFSAIAFNMSNAVNFAYQLIGVDKNWIQSGNRHYASYTNIPSGNYTFRVKAANSEGHWSNEIATIQIHISTPWWRTWWFVVLLALGLGAVAWGFYKWRILDFQKRDRLKIEFERKLADVKMNALRAQINPHFIFNCLNSIDYYIIKNESQKASEYLNQFSRLIRLILQNSSANFVPLKDELEALQLYMQMESMRFNHRFDYEVKIEKNLDTETLEIPPMLLQPYVENAIWHGLMPKMGKGAIQVAITREEGYLRCIIEDNGIGREKAELFKISNHFTKKRSMGMAITQNRIELLNQQLGANTTVNIIDLKDYHNRAIGTRVELNIPINE